MSRPVCSLRSLWNIIPICNVREIIIKFVLSIIKISYFSGKAYQLKLNIMEKSVRFISTLLLSVFLGSCSQQLPEIKWIEGETEADGYATFTIEITGDLPDDWTIWFSQMPCGTRQATDSEAEVIEYQGTLHRIKPLCQKKDTIIARYRAVPLMRHSTAPEGFSFQTSEGITPVDVKYDFLPLEADGEYWYEHNSAIEINPVEGNQIIPMLKNTKASEHPRGWYKITIGDTVTIEAADEDGRYYAGITLEQLERNYGGQIPHQTIEDWPDYQYRGYMLDVSRNFTSKENVMRLIDILSHYKLNYLHMHLADDEGWRLEIPGIPELTSIGAYHSFDPDKGIQPSYDGCADPTDMSSTANGHYSVQDYIEILQYADAHHMKVITEIDLPGHSRAAIKAMQAYEKRTGDASMRLQDPDDDSKYYTAQGYTDNVISVELESAYRWIEKIFDSIIDIYARAGVPLDAIHIGGDEVPEGAWKGENLHPVFLGKIAQIAIDRGVKISGWQEVATCRNEISAELLKSATFTNNVWSTLGKDRDLPYRIADAGYPTVVSSVEYTYADQTYSPNKEEIAHSWACFTDECKTFQFHIEEHENIVGISCQMFTETIRSFDDVCHNTFPKMIGLFDRMWTRKPMCELNHFYSILVAHELPYLDSKGISYHIPQPGLKVIDGVAVTNSLLPGAVVNVTNKGDHYIATTEYHGHSSATTTALKQ